MDSATQSMTNSDESRSETSQEPTQALTNPILNPTSLGPLLPSQSMGIILIRYNVFIMVWFWSMMHDPLFSIFCCLVISFQLYFRTWFAWTSY